MCGIAGRVGPAPLGPEDLRWLEAALAALAARGPDDAHRVALGQAALGTRRLAIVDPEGGRQPLRGERVWVALNGQIYNHHSLRRELAAQGRRFATSSDTEVVAALVEERGVDAALERLDGMFALAVWDPQAQALTLARDRLGQKPLYWWQDGERLSFGSELKALLVDPALPRTPDETALGQLLLFEYIPAPRTIYRGVNKLEAGTRLRWEAGRVSLRRWWEPPLPGVQTTRIAAERWAGSVLNSLQAAVHQRAQCEQPVALLVSGGIDSSAVAALAARFLPSPARTFSVGFDEPSFDESQHAAALARHLGAQHTALRFGPERLEQALGALTAGLCEPLADGSLPSMWLLSQGVKAAGFRVALSGDGADEHFGGYPTYLAHPLAERLAAAGPLARRLAARLPSSTQNLAPTTLARRFGEGLGLPLARRNQVWLGAFLPEELPGLLGAAPAGLWDVVDAWGALGQACPDPASRAMYLDQRLYLGEGVLAKVDRASMMHGLEVRSPFLCHRLVTLSAAIPPELHLRRGQTKALLRQAVAGLLPPELLGRAKKGFGTPLGPWLAGPCAGLLDGLDHALQGVVEPARVRALVQEHRAGVQDHRRRLWTLLLLSRWWRGPWGPGR